MNRLKFLKKYDHLYASSMYFEEAEKSLEWQIAIKEDMQSIEKNSTCEFYIKKKQGEDGIFASQKKYVVALVKKFNMSDCKKALTTNNYGMWFSNLFNFKFVGWTDSDWSRNLDDMKSNSGNCFSFGSGFVIWSTKNQESVALPSSEFEYVPVGTTTKKVLLLRKLLADFCLEQVETTKNPAFHSRFKHIDVQHPLIRQLVA